MGKEARMTASGLESSLISPKAYFLSTIFSAGKLEVITNQRDRGQQPAKLHLWADAEPF